MCESRETGCVFAQFSFSLWENLGEMHWSISQFSAWSAGVRDIGLSAGAEPAAQTERKKWEGYFLVQKALLSDRWVCFEISLCVSERSSCNLMSFGRKSKLFKSVNIQAAKKFVCLHIISPQKQLKSDVCEYYELQTETLQGDDVTTVYWSVIGARRWFLSSYLILFVLKL